MNFIFSILFFYSKFSRTQYEALTKIRDQRNNLRDFIFKHITVQSYYKKVKCGKI